MVPPAPPVPTPQPPVVTAPSYPIPFEVFLDQEDWRKHGDTTVKSLNDVTDNGYVVIAHKWASASVSSYLACGAIVSDIGRENKDDVNDAEKAALDDGDPVQPGAFSPEGFTCMVPCRLGSICPPTAPFSTAAAEASGDPRCQLALGARVRAEKKRAKDAGENKTRAASCAASTFSLPTARIQLGGTADRPVCGGPWSETKCPAKFFCPNVAGTPLPQPCTEGHFCREGTHEPKKCLPVLQTCPAFVERPKGQVWGTVVVFALLLLLWGTYRYALYLVDQKQQKRAQQKVTLNRILLRWASRGGLGGGGSDSDGDGAKLDTERVWEINRDPDNGALFYTNTASGEIVTEKPTNLYEIKRSKVKAEKGGKNKWKAAARAAISSSIASRAETEELDQKQKRGSRRSLRSMLSGGGGGGGSKSRSATLDLEAKTFRIEFTFCDMGLKLKNGGKQVLASVTGSLRHSCLTAIMGPSGAGKTTFLNTISGKAYYGDRTGELLINGRAEPLKKYERITGFVPQDDIMLKEMTVKEILEFYAQLRLPTSWSWEKKHLLVLDVIRILGLEEIRHSRIGDEKTRGISGGQRKRVNVGMELVGDPTLLFLDEPTSGLDSTTSFELLSALQGVARRGVTVVTVLHQPSWQIYSMFDDVLLLGTGGHTVYLGPADGAAGYFESLGFKAPERVNPADYFMDVR